MKRLYCSVLTLAAVLVTAMVMSAQKPTAPKTLPRRPPPPAAPSSSGSSNNWAHQLWKHLERAHTDLQSASADPESHRGKALSAIEQAASELAAGVNNPKVVPTSTNWSHAASTDQTLGSKGALIEANSHLEQAAAQCARISGDLGGHLANVQRLIKQAQSEIAAERAEIQKAK
ncbi:MAG TPA: hypothetical protein VG204_11595 [Terriglobia bacterium]|nr:hypothetical protein [Terriglobia bacterium]